MARVRFTADFDYKPTKACTIAYRGGMEMVVKRDCAEQAIAAGKAVDIYVTSKEPADGTDKISR
jgi:hypothetical protein